MRAMIESAVRTRFAPSPTGFMHLGNVRTALFNCLLARRHGGQFILRLEDTDAARSSDEFAEAIAGDLGWLGLDWDEGPDRDGAAGPYAQSERGAVYEEQFARLEEAGATYSCYLTPEELEQMRRAQRARGRPPRYDREAARLPAGEVEKRIAAGQRPAIRFQVPSGGSVDFEDLVRGRQSFRCADIGDFIIRRADGTPSFFFSNAVDDALMGVSHALRGEDHLANTPRQILLLRALGFDVPRYGHVALLVGADGSPLAKRHGSIALRDLRAQGYLPSGIGNYLARLGHVYESGELLSLAELAAAFDLSRLGRAPAQFDQQQLEHWQHEAAAALSVAALGQWLGTDILERVPEAEREAFLELVRPNVDFPAEAAAWAQIVYAELPFPDEAFAGRLREAGPEFFRAALAALDERGPELAGIGAAVRETTGCKGKALYMPLRLALTGRENGPELAGLVRLVPREELRRRLAAWAQ